MKQGLTFILYLLGSCIAGYLYVEISERIKKKRRK